MSHGSHARGEPPARRPRVRLPWTRPQHAADGRPVTGWTPWRLATPAVVLAVGALLAVSGANSEGTDLRPGRYTDLASLVDAEADEYAELQARLQQLDGEVEALTRSVNDREVDRYHDQVAELKDPAGLTPRTGPGITVTLSDAPEDVINDSVEDVNLLVVHQQDIQAVVNAMWSGGATAVTVAGQRIVSTTGIKCEGNAVQLQGVPYGQPYVIQAVGDPAALQAAIDDSDYLDLYREQSADPAIAIGWDMVEEAEVRAPAYDGLLDLSYARPIR